MVSRSISNNALKGRPWKWIAQSGREIVLIFLWIAIFQSSSFGADLSFVLDTPPFRVVEANIIAAQLGKIGIGVTVRVWDRASLTEEMKKGTRVASLTDWGSSYFDPYDLAHPKLTTGGRGNYSFYSNSFVDEHLQVAAFSSGTKTRKKAYHKIQRIIYEEAPWSFGYMLSNIEAASIRIHGYIPAIDNRINLHDAYLETGDTVTVGINTDTFKSLDPAAYRGRETETVLRNLFDGLVTRTAEGFVVAELAESWHRDDKTTYTFKLRQGSVFHNGDLVTVDDVVFTFQRILHPKDVGASPSPRRGLLGPLSNVEKIDDESIRFLLSKPFPPFLQALVHFQIVPKKYIQRVGEEEFSRKPIGSGPFKFKEGSLKTRIVMERFSDYYGGSPDIPPIAPAKIEEVIFIPIPDSSARVKALLAGEVNIIQAVPVKDMKRLRTSDGLKVLVSEGSRSYQLELNNKRPPFDDVRIRQAINYGIDWDAILEDVYSGHGQRLATCFLPSGFGYKAAIKPYPYKPALARQLLREAGYDVE